MDLVFPMLFSSYLLYRAATVCGESHDIFDKMSSKINFNVNQSAILRSSVAKVSLQTAIDAKLDCL